MLPFIVSCMCVWACARRPKIKTFVPFCEGLKSHLSIAPPSIQTRTVYSGFSDFSHIARSGFPLVIGKDVIRARFLNSTPSNILPFSAPGNRGLCLKRWSSLPLVVSGSVLSADQQRCCCVRGLLWSQFIPLYSSFLHR